jgi:subtilisin family serine protease
MTFLYALILRATPMAVLLAFLSTPVFSQDTIAIESSIIRLKVTEEASAILERTMQSRTSNGDILTGIRAIDKFNELFKVYEFKRVFPPSGKDEHRHRKHGLHRWYELKLNVPGKTLDAVSSFSSLQQIEKAEPVLKKSINGIRRIGVVYAKDHAPKNAVTLLSGTNDPMFPAQWHYNNTGQSSGTTGADVRLLDAWKHETGKRQVVVAVMDGGIDVYHPDLAGNIWKNTSEVPANGLDDDNNGYVDDINGYDFVVDRGSISAHFHGTHVAGTIAAVSNNGIGVSGIAGGSGTDDGVRLMSCAIFSYDDESEKDVAASYVYAADNGAVISQNSWSYTVPNLFEQSVIDAIDYFIAEAGVDSNGNQTGPMKGGIVIFSSGNENSEGSYYPAYYERVLAVAATNHSDVRSYYSNYGTWVDIAAPGGETNSVAERGVLSTLPDNEYGYLQGTSMACPHVSGVAALVLSKYGRSGFNPDGLRRRLTSTSQDISAKNGAYATKLGSGRVNAAAAVTSSDVVPPAAVNNLQIASKASGEVTLRWTVPSDANGFVGNYDLRYSTSSITGSNFATAKSIAVNATATAGQTQQYTVEGLPGETRFYFALKAIDFEGNVSAISNTVSVVTAPTPKIQLSASNISKTLVTAETGTATVVISNTGKVQLDFSIPDNGRTGDRIFCYPSSGSVAPGAGLEITFSFNAAGVGSGSFSRNFTIVSNDPVSAERTIAVTLTVTPNGFPIAVYDSADIAFKGVTIDSTRVRYLRISNRGSDPLVLRSLGFSRPQFSTLTPPVTVEPFSDLQFPVRFTPDSAGVVQSVLTIETNDPENPVIMIEVFGEGVNGPGIEVDPDSLSLVLVKGMVTRKTITLTNNSAFNRTYRVEVLANELANEARPPFEEGRKGITQPISREELIRKFKDGEVQIDPMFQSVRVAEKSQASAAGRETGLTSIPGGVYRTNFEEFREGTISGQNGWYSYPGWDIMNVNPDNGSKHLRGLAMPGTQSYAVSPALYDDYEENLPDPYSTFTALINMDSAAGDQFQVVVQDVYFIATRIRFNPDKTVDVMSVGPNYNSVWNRLNVPAYSGYIEVAVEVYVGSDGTTGFPFFHVFFNGAKVFKGYGLGSFVNSIAYVTIPSNSGGFMDIDSTMMRPGRYTPRYVKTEPAAGMIPAKGSVQVDVAFDPAGLHYQTYKSKIVAHVDGIDKVEVPATVSVTGAGSLVVQTQDIYLTKDYGYVGFFMSNIGGEPVSYTIQNRYPWLQVGSRSGTILPEKGVEVGVDFLEYPDAGLYQDTLKVTTNEPGSPVYRIPVHITVWADETDFYASTPKVHFELSAGASATQEVTLWRVNKDRNDLAEYHGSRDVVYEVAIPADAGFLSVGPRSGRIRGHEIRKIAVKLDAARLEEGSGSTYFILENNIAPEGQMRIDVTYRVHPTDARGKILREVWAGAMGQEVSSIPLGEDPSAVEILTELKAPSNAGDNYGARLRGLIQPPQTGMYTFYLSSDDDSELWLSTDRNESGLRKIAYLEHPVAEGVYKKYASQRSVAIALEADKKYYFEVLHKESLGLDHVSVGWKMPDGTEEFPVASTRILLPERFNRNLPPTVRLMSPWVGQSFSTPATLVIAASALDNDGSISKVEFFKDNEKIGEDMTAPYELRWQTSVRGRHTIMARAADNKGAIASASAYVYITPQGCYVNGYITREVWRSISGSQVSDVPFNSAPAEIGYVRNFEAPSNNGENYGSRIRGYVCVWETGYYTFWISSDNRSELWLSQDDTPQMKRKIAAVSGYTAPLQWDKYYSQRSGPIYLVSGRRYYIEALHKESSLEDHLAVAWKLPSGEMQGPIPSYNLAPVTNDGNILWAPVSTSDLANFDNGGDDESLLLEAGDPSLFPNPVRRGVVRFKVSDDPSPQNIELTVTSLTGSQLILTNLDTESDGAVSFTVDDRFTPGIYVVIGRNGGKRITRRLMVR